MFGKLLCMFRGHRINRMRVWNDGIDHRARCRCCGVPMIRTSVGWRPFDTAIDASTDRQAHPRAQ